MGFRSLINYLVGVPHFEHAKLLSIFKGEKIDVDPSVWFDKLKKELLAGKYSRRTAQLHLIRSLWIRHALPKLPSVTS